MSLEELDRNALSCIYAKLDLDSSLAIRVTSKKHKALVESSVCKDVCPDTGMVETIVNGNPVGILRYPGKPSRFTLRGVGYIEEYDTDIHVKFKKTPSPVYVHSIALKRYPDCKVNIVHKELPQDRWYEDSVTEETIINTWEIIYQSPEKTASFNYDYYISYQAYDGPWDDNPARYEFWEFSPSCGIAICGTIDRNANDNESRVYIKGELVCLQMTKPQFLGIYPLPGHRLDAEKVKELRTRYATNPIDIEPFHYSYMAALIPQ